MAVVCVLAQTGVPDHEQVRRGALHRPRGLLHDPLLVVRLRPGRVLGGGQAKENNAAEPEAPRPLRVPHQLVHRRLKDTGQRGDFPPDALPVTREQGPDELRGNEVGLLYQATQCRGAAQAAQAADRELAHRPSNLDAPWARSKSATRAPAAPGSRSSISADAVICTDPSWAVTRPNRRIPLPASRIPTHAATGA